LPEIVVPALLVHVPPGAGVPSSAVNISKPGVLLQMVKLVLCPEGNGVDTHRFWETLYMGGIPVVTKNPMMQSFYDRLPVLQLNSWKDLSDISLVEGKWWKLTERTYDFEILSADYWIKRFSSK
jgi:hypothetical protein